MRETITLKDIAKALNLSVSTVSKALRNSYEIGSETQALVKEYADRYQYRPNPMAQGLRKGNSKSIAVVVPNIDNNFFSQVINGIESIAHQNDYNVIVTQTHESYEREVLTVQHHFSRSVDGLIVSLSSETDNTDHFAGLQENGLPIVFVDRVPEKITTHKVIANNFQGAYEATKHLIGQGFKNIAHITSTGFLSITRERLAGYSRALEENNIPVREDLIKYCAHGGMIRDEVYAAVYDLMTMRKKPDAIFMASDRLSTTTLSILNQMKLRIPEQVALAGFTNSFSAEIFNPSFTTVVQPAIKMGQLATEMLISLIESKRPITSFDKKILDTELIIRDSSKRK